MTSAISSVSSSAAASSASAKSSIAGNFDTFLQLLTTQLQNQNPLDPMDTNQFTQQLVQFSSVEQQLKTNDLLGTLVAATSASKAANAASYLGATVTADGSTATLANGSATWTWNAAKASSKATITITNASGATVYAQTSAIPAGASTFTWDGRTNDGSLLTGGDYTIKVDAIDASGQSVSVSTEVGGTVNAVDMTTDPPSLTIGNLSVPLDKIKSLRKAGS